MHTRAAVESSKNPADANRGLRPSDFALFDRTAEACRRNYRDYRNVLGVGVGLKFNRGCLDDGGLCIQFWVSRKVKRPGRSRLPRYVYGRHRDGSLMRGRRLPTDVVVVRKASFACASGQRIDAPGEFGSITLLFRNPADGQFYLLTCAHVAGDLLQSPPAMPDLDSDCCQNSPFATTRFNSTHQQGVVDWDVALARVNTPCTPQPELRVIDSETPLRRLRAEAGIYPGAPVECAGARSGRFPGIVASDARTLYLRLDGIEYLVHNLFLLHAAPLPGDSGGLVFDGDEAIGILVGLAGDDAGEMTGWGLFQPLEGALNHVTGRCGMPLTVPLQPQ